MNDQVFCQSCAMPMGNSDDMCGTEADGSKNKEYCQYCYQNGQFTADTTMEEMIDFCVPHTMEAGVYKSAEEARDGMMKYFPQLKRWATA